VSDLPHDLSADLELLPTPRMRSVFSKPCDCARACRDGPLNCQLLPAAGRPTVHLRVLHLRLVRAAARTAQACGCHPWPYSGVLMNNPLDNARCAAADDRLPALASLATAIATAAALAAAPVALDLLHRRNAVHFRQHRPADGRLGVRARPELSDLRQLARHSAHIPRAYQLVFLLRDLRREHAATVERLPAAVPRCRDPVCGC